MPNTLFFILFFFPQLRWMPVCEKQRRCLVVESLCSPRLENPSKKGSGDPGQLGIPTLMMDQTKARKQRWINGTNEAWKVRMLGWGWFGGITGRGADRELPGIRWGLQLVPGQAGGEASPSPSYSWLLQSSSTCWQGDFVSPRSAGGFVVMSLELMKNIFRCFFGRKRWSIYNKSPLAKQLPEICFFSLSI